MIELLHDDYVNMCRMIADLGEAKVTGRNARYRGESVGREERRICGETE